MKLNYKAKRLIGALMLGGSIGILYMLMFSVEAAQLEILREIRSKM